jgi:hypothetical protein
MTGCTVDEDASAEGAADPQPTAGPGPNGAVKEEADAYVGKLWREQFESPMTINFPKTPPTLQTFLE